MNALTSTAPHERKRPDKTCGAKTRSGGRCKRSPRENGRCNLHGGKSLRGPDSPTWKHGLTSRYADADPAVKENINAFASDPGLARLSPLALAWALHELFVEKWPKEALANPSLAVAGMKLTSELSQIADRELRRQKDLEAVVLKVEVEAFICMIHEHLERCIQGIGDRAFVERFYGSWDAELSAMLPQDSSESAVSGP